MGSASKPFPPGVHVPTLTFFHGNPRQDIDWDTQRAHLEYLIKSGVHGVVVNGTNAEAISLTPDEKGRLITETRDIAIKLGKPNLPLTAGCSGGCTRDVIDQTIAAHRNGADFALVLISSYFHFALTPAAIVDFFREVADNSPIPIVIYNFPDVVAGLDVNSEMLDKLSAHPNICAVKLTCGGIAKVARVAETNDPSRFAALAGQGDWLFPALSVGGTGCIAGIANVFPRILVEIYNLFTQGKIAEATKLQKKLSKAEWGLAKGGLNGTKWIVVKIRGYPETSADCRRPVPKFVDAEKRECITSRVYELLPVEEQLAAVASW